MTSLARLRHDRPFERGSVLPLALITMLLFSVLGFSLVAMGTTEMSISGSWKQYSAAFYGAEAGVESAVVALRDLITSTPTPTNAQLAAIVAPTLPDPKLAFTAFSVTRVVPNPPYSYPTTFSSGPYAGFSAQVTDYLITSEVRGDNGTKSRLSQVIRYVQVPLFQFGVFYGKGVDLEIAPGANMTFNGRVHSNSNLYVGAGASLSFDSTMTAAGGVFRRIKRDTSIPWGNNPQIKDQNGTYRSLDFDHDYQPGFGSTWAPTAWQAQATSTFGNTVRDEAMGVGQIVPPIPALSYNPSNPDVIAHQLIEVADGSDAPDLRAAKMYSKSGLRIVDGVATDIGGNAVTLPGGIVTNTTFYDMREQRTMNIVQVDVGALRASGAAPANGVLYVATTGTPGAAVRLVNGSRLPSQGLTVVSENPVYVRGDYNTEAKVPAGILADAITVLSNNWQPNNSDSKGDLGTNTRLATATTVNAALASGPSAESAINAGNGQLENDIRFLEDWNGQNFTYSGSIVNLWHSQQATGAWRCCGTGGTNYYTAPTLIWSYDTLFNASPPPGTPQGVLIQRGPWVQK
jgi:Tfp pilus assembly protein PilX